MMWAAMLLLLPWLLLAPAGARSAAAPVRAGNLSCSVGGSAADDMFLANLTLSAAAAWCRNNSRCAGFVLVSLYTRGVFFSSNRVARLSSAYDFWCGVTPSDLLLNESCVFLAFICRLLAPSIPAGLRVIQPRGTVIC